MMSISRCHAAALAILIVARTAGLAMAQPVPSTVSIEDVLAFRQIQEVRMSPDGTKVAFVTRIGRLDLKKNQDSLMIVAATGGETRTLATADSISQVSWDRGGAALYGLFEQDGEPAITRVDAGSGSTSALWKANGAIDQFAVSPDGSRCLAAVRVESASSVAQDRIDRGMVFEYGRHSGATIRERQYSDIEWLDFVLVDTAAKTSRSIGRIPFEGFRHLDFADRIVFSPDNRRAAIELVRPGKPTEGGAPFNHDIGVLDLETGRYEEPLPGSIRTDMGPVWLGGSARLFFVSDGEARVYDVAARSVSSPPWAKLAEANRFVTSGSYHAAEDAVYLLARRALMRMSFRTQKVEQVATIYQPPSFSDDFKSYALVSESSSERPEVAVVDARSSTPRRVTNLNPWLDARSLGRVEKLDITNKSGVATTGYLVHPVGATPGRKAPLVIASYGFQGRFIVTAEWHTTFPAQTLAGRGYAVLLLNTPPLPSAQITVGDPVKARDNEGWQVLASYDAAIDLLVQRGIADPDRIGLYGWSHGAFVVEFVLAHSKRRFGAAIVGEGGDYNPGGYWVFGSASWPAIYRNTFGGPFTAANAKAYLEFSPVLNVDKVQTPLLMEFVAGNAVSGFEFYVPLREAKVPAEMVLYDREAHNFVRPTVRFASMHRKVDWLDFWLLDKEDADPAKAAQYTRWKQLKTEWKR